MSKARTLADILDSNNDVQTSYLDTVDLTPVKQDVATLAFESARADNRAAYNLPNAFIDQFEDDSGIDTTSSSQRNASEYVSAVVVSDVEFHPRAELTWGGQLNGANETWSEGPTINGSQRKFETTAVNSGYHYSTSTIDLDGVQELTFEYEVVIKGGGGGPNFVPRFNKNGGTSSISYTGTTTSLGISGIGFDVNSSVGDRIKITYDVSTDVMKGYEDNGSGTYGSEQTTESSKGGAWESTTPTSMGLFHTGYTDGGSNWHIGVYNGIVSQLVTNATGNFTSTSQTASASVSSMSIVVMYEDSSGTATLNTDLVAQVSANNGTDFTTVTLEAAPNLTNTIKVAKSAAISVTAGTQPKYKINFANQADGSKVTRILGVSLLY